MKQFGPLGKASKRRELRPRALSPEFEIFRNEFVRLYSVRAEFDGFSKDYFVTDKGQRVGTILWNGTNILLVRQYRLLVDQMSWELPGGGIKSDESAERAAIRECREEAGIACRSIRRLFHYQQGIDTTISPAYLFESNDFEVLSEVATNQETDDRIWLPHEECMRWVFAGEIMDSMTILALLAWDAIRARAPAERAGWPDEMNAKDTAVSSGPESAPERGA